MLTSTATGTATTWVSHLSEELFQDVVHRKEKKEREFEKKQRKSFFVFYILEKKGWR